MTALDLVRLSSSLLFVLIALAVFVAYARDRRRETLAALLFFGALGLVIVASYTLPTLGLQGERAVTLALVAVLLALPLLELNLVGVHGSVHRRAMQLGVAGYVLSTVPILVLDPTPPWVAVPILGYFIVTGLYVAFLLVRGARASSGPAAPREWSAAAGALLLAVTFLATPLRAASPEAADVATRVLGLLTAVAFLVAFAPPEPLRRAWREPIARNLLRSGPAILTRATLDDVLGELERSAVASVGAQAAFIAVAKTAQRAQSDPIVARVAATAAKDGFDHEVPDGTGVILATPIAVGNERLGALAVRFARRPMFMDATREALSLVALNVAVLLTAAIAASELREQNAALDAASRAAQDATRAKSEFLANMSHELRTPLNSILGFSDLLATQLSPIITDRQAKFLRNIRDAGDHLLQLINDVLDLAKVEARRIELHPEAVSFDAVLAPVVQAIGADARKRGLEFTVEVPDGLTITVDPLRLRQILLNLLSNAMKFTPASGRVALCARVSSEATLVVEVADTGIGIPADKIDRVFGTFERFHEGRYEAQGTGLGLALTKQLVELHGGHISFVTSEGKGTVFTLHLPDAVVRIDEDRVLIVEDEARDADLIAALAQREGLQVELAASVESARRAIRRRTPIAIVLDLRLPDGRGEDVLAEIDVLPHHPRIPTIVVSVEDDEGRSRLSGADDHLTKPIDHARLVGWLRQVAARTTGAEHAVAAR
ncbi:MAG TPA: ATP-binding protein [Candidatus Acidoferrales bacterium]|nr:ATP-binding protein [Candidatus Acidoferrales bacterium]